MRRDITVETELPYPPGVVWQALTDPEALSQWLMPIHDFAPVVGRRFQLRAKPVPGWDGVVDCTVLEAAEPYRLSYSWQGSRMRRSTTVVWTLTALGEGGTRLRLEHQGFEGLGGLLLAFMHQGGWKKFLRTALPGHLGRNQASSGGER
jgi:uncharacterized protein YndB with AHSA1/START domain